jgi:hypothetical protein
MTTAMRIGLVVCVAAPFIACKTVDQRYYYRQGITAFEKHIPGSNKTCWLTPDTAGGSSGDNAIAEEEFTRFLIEKNLCKIVEKSVDDVAGYSWPKEEVCPCGSGVSPCASQCSGASAVGAVPAVFGATASINDNNRSNYKLLERYKKSQLVDKVLVYRIDDLNKDRAIIHFRLSDAKAASGGAIESSQTYVILPRVEVAASTEAAAQ